MSMIKVVLSEAELDDLRMDFDWQCDHGWTAARTFYSWLRRRGYRRGTGGEWYYVKEA